MLSSSDAFRVCRCADNEAQLNGTMCLITQNFRTEIFALSFISQHNRAENVQAEEEMRLTGGRSTVTRYELDTFPPPPSWQRLETMKFNCLILGSPTWQNLPFNEIRSGVLLGEFSFQGHNCNKGEIRPVCSTEMISFCSPMTHIFAFIFYLEYKKRIFPRRWHTTHINK